MSRIEALALPEEAFAQISRQLLTIVSGCSEQQLVDMADVLHDLVRQRRDRRYESVVTLPRRHTG